MSTLHTVINWSSRYHREFNIPRGKGFLLIKYKEKYRKNVEKVLLKLDQWQEKKIAELDDPERWESILRDLDDKWEIHYKKRSLAANDLMWSLYEIEAHVMNAGHQSSDMETPEHIYQLDMEHFAPKFGVSLKQSDLELLKRQYSMIKVVAYTAGKVQANVYLTSSHFDSKQMHTHLEMLFDRLSMAGVDLKSSADISHYWLEWRQNLNDEKYILHDELYTIAEYQELVKNCEACGDPVWHESVDSGVTRIKEVTEPGVKYYGSQLLHLCGWDFTQFNSGKDAFLKKYPHLKFKIETCLRREYKEDE